MICTGMRGIIELIRKHPKIRRILRCESPYFHHWLIYNRLPTSEPIMSSKTNNNNNIQDNVYGAFIMAKPLREFTRFI